MRLNRAPLCASSKIVARITAAFGALTLAIVMGTAVAQAQTASPAPAATPAPAGQTNPAGPPPSTTNPTGGQPPVPARPVSAPAALSHLPIIDFVATFTQPAYYTNSSQIQGYDPLDLGGTVRIPVTRRFSLFFDRITEGTINQPLQAQGATLPKDSRDIILQYHGTYNIANNFTIDAGESFRHRIWNSGASGVSAVPFPTTVASTEHHFAYLGFAYTTKPWKELFNSSFALAETLDAQNVDHHVGILCTGLNLPVAGCTGAGSVGVRDENPGVTRYYETTQGVTWIVPVDPKHGATFLANEKWGALNFYENQPYPWHYATAFTLQLNKRFSPGFTLSLRHQDLHESEVGSPFPAPSVIHVGAWDVLGTFHLDTNTLFH